eukprot:35522-Eustigmatos_ZCMA.PRE.1
MEEAPERCGRRQSGGHGGPQGGIQRVQGYDHKSAQGSQKHLMSSGVEDYHDTGHHGAAGAGGGER